MRLLQRHNPRHQLGRRRPAVLERRPRQVVQTRWPKLPVTAQPFVAGLARYPEPLAQLRHRLLVLQPRNDKLQPLVHDASLSPNHRRSSRRTRKLSPMQSGPVCYLSIRFGQRGTSPRRDGRRARQADEGQTHGA